jgi:hypothetical protein
MTSTNEVSSIRELTSDEMKLVAGGLPPGIIVAAPKRVSLCPTDAGRSANAHNSGDPGPRCSVRRKQRRRRQLSQPHKAARSTAEAFQDCIGRQRFGPPAPAKILVVVGLRSVGD